MSETERIALYGNLTAIIVAVLTAVLPQILKRGRRQDPGRPSTKRETITLALAVFASVSSITSLIAYGTTRQTRSVVDLIKSDTQFRAELGLQLAVPVGSVLSSMLSPADFATAVGDPRSFSPTTNQWSPADGRSVGGSGYEATTSSSTVPDLRGLFLRGLNQFDAHMGSRIDGFEDPNGNTRRAGDTQADIVGTHSHRFGFGPAGMSQLGNGPDIPVVHPNHPGVTANPLHTGTAGGAETRPRNSAVYYYVRINK